MPKYVVINGSGRSGKDTLVSIASYISEWSVMNFSSVAVVKEAAKILGCEGKKTPADRKFLSDLKQLSIQYNNQPNEYLVYSANRMPDKSLGFFHIREPQEIRVFKSSLIEWVDTLLVKRYTEKYGNDSDDLVEDYRYDYIIDNSGTIENLVISTANFLDWVGVEVDADRYTKMLHSASSIIRSSDIQDGVYNIQEWADSFVRP